MQDPEDRTNGHTDAGGPQDAGEPDASSPEPTGNADGATGPAAESGESGGGGPPADETPADAGAAGGDGGGGGRRRWGRGRRALWLSIQLGILLVIVLGIGTVGFVEYSAQPGFCNNCHNMVPYYESWASSTHNSVSCVQCHYAPGIKAEAMGKLQAANQVVKYITGTYGLKPWAEVEDAACLRSGCHATRKLEGEVTFKGVRFDHTTHLGELRRGKQLRCTSCHSQIVQGEHLTVTESTCFLCHFKDRPENDPIGGCTGCHPSPPQIVSPAGFVINHTNYVSDLISCASCHDDVVEGTGTADRSRCFICHNEPERLNQFENTDFMHRTHIAEHNVECAQCHMEIQHRAISHADSPELECRNCHTQTHDNQRKLYAGTGGQGTADMPSSMFLANVSCNGCHELATTVRGHESVDVAGEASCMSCHGTQYANILPGWVEEINRKTARVATVVRGAQAAAASARPGARADSLVRAAAANLSLVENGKGVHNIAFADQLLRQAVDDIRQAARSGLRYSVPALDLGPPVTSNQCMECHLGTERSTVDFQGRSFDHERHVLRGGMDCSACHAPMDQHPGTRLTSTAQCQACHHRTSQPIPCERCHEGSSGVPTRTWETPAGNFQHQPHVAAELTCTTCHVPPGMTASRLSCENCHDSHHQADSNCLSCHQADSGVKALHTLRDAHSVLCTSCHQTGADNLDTWTRQICTVCHVDQVEHEAPQPCESCHVMPQRRAPAPAAGSDPHASLVPTPVGAPDPHAPGAQVPVSPYLHVKGPAVG